MLIQILDEATEMHNSLQAGTATAAPQQMNFDAPMTDDVNLLSQLEQVLSNSTFSLQEIDNLLGINNQSQARPMVGHPPPHTGTTWGCMLADNTGAGGYTCEC